MERPRLLRELWASGPGRLGLVLLACLAGVSLYVLGTFPRDFGSARWANPALWADHPKAVPPAWTNWFTPRRRAEHLVLEARRPTEITAAGRTQVHLYVLSFPWRSDEPPTFLSLSVADVTYHARPPVVTASLVRPDGHEAVLYRQVLAGPRPGETAPYRRHTTVPLRVQLSTEPRSAEAAAGLLEREYGVTVSREELRTRVDTALFGIPAPGGELAVLRGDYEVKVQVLAGDPQDSVRSLRVVVGGAVYGWMGTDALGRDLAQGLLFGLPVALLIGLAASTASTLLGTSLGLISGYVGGWVDTGIQRVADVAGNVPVLPLLIFLVFIGGSQLWLILLVLVAFSWPGLTIVVRTMVLQLRSGVEVEAAQALGASRARILLKHVFPHTASYILAQLVFFAPSAILAEAGLSFLGLGDPSLPTWGQILEDGFRTGAVFLGYWWWVIPPGLLIVVTAVTFMLLALGLESVVDPRLRGRRLWLS